MSEESAALGRIEALLRSLVRISLTEPASRLLTDERLRDLYEGTGKLKRRNWKGRLDSQPARYPVYGQNGSVRAYW